MATVNVTNLFLNENKRYREDVVMTIPSVIQSGGGRSQADPVYLQGSDDIVAYNIEVDTIVQKAYLIVDEAFPAGALLGAVAAETTIFTDVDLTATGITVSVAEDFYHATKGHIVAAVTGIVGDVTTGKARIVLATEHPSLKNGQYAN